MGSIPVRAASKRQETVSFFVLKQPALFICQRGLSESVSKVFVYIDDTDLLLPPFDPDIIVLYCIFLLECGLHINRNNKAGGADRTGSAGRINCQIYVRYKREKDTGMSDEKQIAPCPFTKLFNSCS